MQNTHTKQLQLLVIYGSNREERLCDTVVNWVLSGVERSRLFTVSTLDPRGLDEAASAAGVSSRDVYIQQALDAADSVLIATPEYNHSFPAAVKDIIDAAQREWWVKPVSFVSYGGLSGGIRAVEQLRQVFVEMHSVCIRASLSLPNAWELFDTEGQIKDAQQRGTALAAMLQQLHWWAWQLRYSRQSALIDYSEVA